jgi:hypothetical protein
MDIRNVELVESNPLQMSLSTPMVLFIRATIYLCNLAVCRVGHFVEWYDTPTIVHSHRLMLLIFDTTTFYCSIWHRFHTTQLLFMDDCDRKIDKFVYFHAVLIDAAVLYFNPWYCYKSKYMRECSNQCRFLRRLSFNCTVLSIFM